MRAYVHVCVCVCVCVCVLRHNMAAVSMRVFLGLFLVLCISIVQPGITFVVAVAENTEPSVANKWFL
jgi:hypothetical protein